MGNVGTYRRHQNTLKKSGIACYLVDYSYSVDQVGKILGTIRTEKGQWELQVASFPKRQAFALLYSHESHSYAVLFSDDLSWALTLTNKRSL